MDKRFTSDFDDLKTLDGKYRFIKTIEHSVNLLSDVKNIRLSKLEKDYIKIIVFNRHNLSVQIEITLENGYAEGCNNINIKTLHFCKESFELSKKVDCAILNVMRGTYK